MKKLFVANHIHPCFPVPQGRGHEFVVALLCCKYAVLMGLLQ
ncbi:Uncharacterized protein dnm_030920 [Desulfonema magnum]|uniref:Uncharacterized protein n=1 Tax=Desulfonema magnum TaxID=45655 RepID=A0A975BKE8_9BACT|nr:Uncharacterized protein dnm_030920 [Desulfonema magnum]